MTMGCSPYERPETAARLFRRHIAEMRTYAAEVQAIIGNGPIAQRIRKCAGECEAALDRIGA
jgi:hypothetical protein